MTRGVPEFEVSQHWLPHGASLDTPKTPFVRKESDSTGSPDYATRSSSGGLVGNYNLYRHPFRTLMLVIVPPLITAYFIVIWQVIAVEDVDVLKYGHRNATWVYYSWFVVGVFGLNVSRYGLAGVEAAMLQDPFWKVDNAMALMMHSEKGWSGFSGWNRVIKRLIKRKGFVTQRLWYLLAVLSLIVSAALPLSGLSLELYDGYVYSAQHPSVIGHNYESFPQRQLYLLLNRAASFWQTANPITVPGIGIAYTPAWVDRKRYTSFAELPNSLPLEEDIPEIFITVQSTVPFSGPVWGLKASYNCSVAESMSSFTILPQKSASRPSRISGITGQTLILNTPLNDTIHLFNSSASIESGVQSNNLWAYGELGFSNNLTAKDYSINTINEWVDSERPRVMEYILWQYRYKESYPNVIEFDPELKPTIDDVGYPYLRVNNGTFPVNDSFFDMKENDYIQTDAKSFFTDYWGKEVLTIGKPIGVRCIFSSETGTANVDARTSSFSTFNRTNPKFNMSGAEAFIPRFGKTAAELLSGHFYELFTSTNSPPPVSYSNSVMYPNFVMPKVLKQAMMRAFAADALQLMYDGLGSFEGAFIDANLTSSKEGKILGSGSVPPLLPAILFGIWAFSCAVLGCAYGFRPRWSEQLDGFTMFSYGVHLSEEITDRSMLTSGKPFEVSEGLREVPGITSDARPSDFRVMHV